MKRIVFGFLFVLFVFNVNAKDLYDSGLDKFQNAQSIISKSTLPNNDQTDAIIAEAKQLMPDEDWAKIDAMEGDKKLIHVRNLLAVKAYETLRKEWMDDFKAQVAKRNDTVWEIEDEDSVTYQRETAKLFNAQEYEGADIQCEKVCYVMTDRWFDELATAYFAGCKDSGEICYNVTQIPDDWEEVYINEYVFDDKDHISRSLNYVVDSVADDMQIVLSAGIQYDVGVGDDFGAQSVFLDITKITKKLSRDRELQNASRRDYKNGKMKDMLEHDGFVTKKWSPVDAGGRIQSKQFDFFWQKDEAKN